MEHNRVQLAAIVQALTASAAKLNPQPRHSSASSAIGGRTAINNGKFGSSSNSRRLSMPPLAEAPTASDLEIESLKEELITTKQMVKLKSCSKFTLSV